MKCSICGKELNAPHGIELAEGVFVCGTANCAEFAVRVVEAARGVVEQYNRYIAPGQGWEVQEVERFFLVYLLEHLDRQNCSVCERLLNTKPREQLRQVKHDNEMTKLKRWNEASIQKGE